jgi:hypothetical protein
MRKLGDCINLRDGKALSDFGWGWANVDLDDPQTYLGNQDILTLTFDYCTVDLGWYGGEIGNGGHFTIMIIIPELDGEYSSESWHPPYNRIACLDADDMLVQLQRAIDVYPKIRNKEQHKRDIELDKRIKISDAIKNAKEKNT